MASVERAMAKAAAALLPGLLPTPPRSTVAPCPIILPPSFVSKPMPGRADSVERWDAHKKPRSPASSSSCGSSSPGRASSCERWDINKKIPGSSSSSNTSSSQGSSSTLCEKWDCSSKRPPSRASSADRWDAQKKARSAQADAQSRTGEKEDKITGMVLTPSSMAAAIHGRLHSGPTVPCMDPVFAGSSFFASPEPSMLPMPTFFLSRGPAMMPVPSH